jgi:hypothetical protein
VALGALGDVDGIPSPCGTGARAELGGDGPANAAHTSTAPIMPSPIAIKARTRRLGCQLNELKISLDPLVDSGHDMLSAQHAEVRLIPRALAQAASVRARRWATSIRDGGNDGWRRAIEDLRDSYHRLPPASRCRCRSDSFEPPCAASIGRLHLQLGAPTAIG